MSKKFSTNLVFSVRKMTEFEQLEEKLQGNTNIITT